MGTFVVAASVGDFKNMPMKKVTVNGQEIMLARVGQNYYAIGNRCPHMHGDLSAGKLEGTIVTCPRHGSQFDITDGHNVRWLGSGLINAVFKSMSSPKPARSYKVKVQGNDVMVEI